MTLPDVATDVPVPRLLSIEIHSFRSIRECSVTLQPLTILVGPNGSGKSNFFDALNFLSSAATQNLANAISQRGSGNDLLFRSVTRSTVLEIGVTAQLDNSDTVSYRVAVEFLPQNRFQVIEEEFVVNRQRGWRRLGNQFRSVGDYPGVAYIPTQQELALPQYAIGQDKKFVQFLASITTLRLATDQMRMSQSQTVNWFQPDGSNVAGILREIESYDSDGFRRLNQYLQRMVPGLAHVHGVLHGAQSSLRFTTDSFPDGSAASFAGSEVSEGTLRSLGTLVAIFHARLPVQQPREVICIEEPEMGLHPRAAAVLMDALQEASAWVQLLVSTHSPDLLDTKLIRADCLRTVRSVDGATQVLELDEAGQRFLSEQVFTAGELLRSNYDASGSAGEL
jgi:predicted ATPase